MHEIVMISCTIAPLGYNSAKKGLHDQNNPIYKRLPLSLQGPAAPPCLSFVVACAYLWSWSKIRLSQRDYPLVSFTDARVSMYQMATSLLHCLLRISHLPGITHTVYIKWLLYSIMAFLLLKQHVIGNYQK